MLKRLCCEFGHGASSPSLISVVTALLVAAVLFVSCFLFITPELMASGAQRYLAGGKYDHYNFTTAEVLKLSRCELSGPAVFILGTSSDQEAVVNCAALAEIISSKVNIAPAVHILTTPGQSHWEMAAVAEMLPRRFDGVVLLGLGVTPPRFLLPREELARLVKAPRLGFVSECFDKEARLEELDPPRRTGNYFWDNRRFFCMRIPKLLRNLITGPVASERHAPLYKVWYYDGDAEIAQTKERLKVYDQESANGLAVLSRIAERMTRRGHVSVVIVQSPANPEFIARAWGKDLYEKHHQRMREYAEEHGMLYWDLAEAAGLKTEDFYDWTHIRESQARLRYTTVLGENIANLLQVTLEKENR